MNPSLHFDALYSGPETDLSLVVEYPDLIYHARHAAAAARSYRYRYVIADVRNKHDITLIRGAVFLDGRHCADFLRIEYRASRLIGLVRASNRRLGDSVLAWLRIDGGPEATIRLHRCGAIEAYQLELWSTLEAPDGMAHDHAVLDLMGRETPITRTVALAHKLATVAQIRHVELAFREADAANPNWDNNVNASVYVPLSGTPDDPAERVHDPNYRIDFARSFFHPAGSIAPVCFRNWRMSAGDPESNTDNVLSRRWLLQREAASRLVYVVEGTLPPDGVEGCHRHVGAEELIYVVAGQGLAYVAAGDLPDAEQYPATVRPVFGIGDRPCRELPLAPGALLYTKTGGVHGLHNTGSVPLTYIAYLYQTD